MLGLEPCRADAEDRAAAADVIERRRHLRDEGRLPEGVGAHHQPDRRVGRGLRPCSDRQPALIHRAAIGADDRVDVVPRPERVVAEPVREKRPASRRLGQSVSWFQQRAPNLIGASAMWAAVARAAPLGSRACLGVEAARGRRSCACRRRHQARQAPADRQAAEPTCPGGWDEILAPQSACACVGQDPSVALRDEVLGGNSSRHHTGQAPGRSRSVLRTGRS